MCIYTYLAVYKAVMVKGNDNTVMYGRGSNTEWYTLGKCGFSPLHGMGNAYHLWFLGDFEILRSTDILTFV